MFNDVKKVERQVAIAIVTYALFYFLLMAIVTMVVTFKFGGYHG